MNVTIHTKDNSYNKHYNDRDMKLFNHYDINDICDDHNINASDIIKLTFNDTNTIQVNLHRTNLSNIDITLNNCKGIFHLHGITNKLDINIDEIKRTENINQCYITVFKNTEITGDIRANRIRLFQEFSSAAAI